MALVNVQKWFLASRSFTFLSIMMELHKKTIKITKALY